MSKRKSGSRPAKSKPSAKSKSQSAERARRPAVAPSESGTSRTWLIGGLVVVVLIAIGVVIVLLQTSASTPSAPAPATNYLVGSAQSCAGDSAFVSTLGFSQRSALDTRAKFVRGAALRELDQNGNIVRSYEHPSWSMAGYLGSFQRDEFGNIYLVPTPFINILDNPPEKANIIYRIDSETGEMSPLVDLPPLGPLAPENPFGLLDITYDCDTHSLYASSVMGSTYGTVAGSIFQVDPQTGEVRDRLDRVDAFGIGVFNGLSGKRLYFGLARTPEIYSVALDDTGAFTDDIRLETVLTDVETFANEHASSITFHGPAQLVIKMEQFDFNLVSPTEHLTTYLSYTYNADADTWDLMSSQKVSE
ncbi:MAG: hypothetical protein KJ065_02180 [Anaerolineae bacterium]|nr:hypothetical protein [Anaerolineae bacterium]